jgi:hypothetical protein
MNELENDSVFVLKLILIIAGFLMFCYSRIGTYLFFFTGAFGYSLFVHHTQGIPIIRFFVPWAVILSVLFEVFYPILSRHTKPDYVSAKEEFDSARTELHRRRTGEMDNQEIK